MKAYVKLTMDAARETEKEDDEGKIAKLWRRMMTPKKLPGGDVEDE